MLLIDHAKLCFILRHSLFPHSVYQFVACARQIRKIYSGVFNIPIEERDSPDAIRVYARRYRVIRVNPWRPGLYCL